MGLWGSQPPSAAVPACSRAAIAQYFSGFSPAINASSVAVMITSVARSSGLMRGWRVRGGTI